MAEFTRFRFGEQTLADLDALAGPTGNRTQAARDAIAYWLDAVAEAALINEATITSDMWRELLSIAPTEWPSDSRDERTRSQPRVWARDFAAWFTARFAMPTSCVRDLITRLNRMTAAQGYAMVCAIRFAQTTTPLPPDWWKAKHWLK